MNHIKKHKGGYKPSPVEPFLKELEKKPCFSSFPLRELLAPGEYVDKIAETLSRQVKISQLRKFFTELKEIAELGEEKPEEAQIQLWKVYPLIAYAQGRKLIPQDFAKLLETVLQKVEAQGCNKKEDYKHLKLFMEALVAYFRKYNPRG
jgi:CRISPR type III-A-associated protein Csm2